SISRSFTVPAVVGRATLTWSDRIQNFFNQFVDPNQEFRVQILTSAGALIQTVFSTNPGDPLIQLGPNNRSFDITSLLLPRTGQTLQLRFQQQDDSFFFNVTLDNISLSVDATPPAADSDFYALNLSAGQPVSIIASLPGFTSGTTSFSATRTDF